MYSLMMEKNFISQHYLIGGKWGTENEKHSHHYKLEVEITGPILDPHYYLIDIVDLEKNMDEVIGHYQEKTLNSLPEFIGKNPSIELFCQLLWQMFEKKLKLSQNYILTIRLWENNIARASYSHNINL